IGFAVGRISQQAGAIHEVEPATRNEAYAVLAGCHMCPNDTCEAIAIRNSHGSVTQYRSPLYQFIGVRSPAEETEVRRYLQFYIYHMRSFSKQKIRAETIAVGYYHHNVPHGKASTAF